MNKKRHLPSPLISLLPLVVLVLMLVATIRAYGSDSLLGASQVTLLVVSAFCVLLGTTVLGVPWADLKDDYEECSKRDKRHNHPITHWGT